MSDERKGIKFSRQQGEAHWRARLTEAKVRAIRKLAADGYSHAQLARRYGVGANTIRKVVTRQSWGHVEEDEV